MIRYTQDDILQSSAEALVNTVNTVGVMGKGIALQFKEAFPNNFKEYARACKGKELVPGKLLAVWDDHLHYGRKLVINFPTKVHWRSPSKYEYIEQGLVALADLLGREEVGSVAVPPLGCGHGGLEWSRVKQLIEQYLADLPLDVLVYTPNRHIKEILQKQTTQKKAKLTPARSLLLYALFAYESLGEYSSLFAANKLAYFLQRMGQPLRLDFKPHHYGPYAIGVEKVLYQLNGVYLKGLEQGQAAPFEALKLDYAKFDDVTDFIRTKLSDQESQRLDQLMKLIDGFTSELSLEILATVDFIMDKHPSIQVDEIMEKIWNTRKKELFKKEYVQIAYDHLIHYRSSILT